MSVSAAPLGDAEAMRLTRAAVDALQRGSGPDARRLLERITGSGRANVQIWLLLAMACRLQADHAAEEAALDAVLALDDRIVRARIHKADCRLRAGDEGSALGIYRSALRLAADQPVPDDLAAELRRAEVAAVDLEVRREARREASLAEQGVGADRRSARFQLSLDYMAGRERIFVQEPTSYYFPGLPAIPFFDRRDFAWVERVEDATAAIRDELAAIVTAGGGGFVPYLRAHADRLRLDDNVLLDSADWSALFLCENGTRFDDAIARAPATWAAVQAAPLPRIANSPTVMFSLLRPGARIAPHTGTHNTRLTCHLPLVVPPGCGFRVGSETRTWTVGELLIFDDSIEHEAWNEGEEDRVVLIFDVWRPELSDRERHEVGALFQAALLD